MAEEDTRSGGSFSTKEMLVRLDGKLDTVITHQSSFDVRITLAEDRVKRLEDESKAGHETHAELRREISAVVRKVAFAFGAGSALVVAANVAIALIHH